MIIYEVWHTWLETFGSWHMQKTCNVALCCRRMWWATLFKRHHPPCASRNLFRSTVRHDGSISIPCLWQLWWKKKRISWWPQRKIKAALDVESTLSNINHILRHSEVSTADFSDYVKRLSLLAHSVKRRGRWVGAYSLQGAMENPIPSCPMYFPGSEVMLST